MEELRISFETAKVAKEKGFDWETNYYYDTAGDLCSEIRKVNWNQSKEKIYSNPNQSLLQKWLRETYKIHIGIDYDDNGWAFFFLTNLNHNKDISWSKNYETYELALEAGLQKALNEIK